MYLSLSPPPMSWCWPACCLCFYQVKCAFKHLNLIKLGRREVALPGCDRVVPPSFARYEESDFKFSFVKAKHLKAVSDQLACLQIIRCFSLPPPSSPPHIPEYNAAASVLCWLLHVERSFRILFVLSGAAGGWPEMTEREEAVSVCLSVSLYVQSPLSDSTLPVKLNP